MADASLNRRMTVRLGDAVAFAQIGARAARVASELDALSDTHLKRLGLTRRGERS